ncbi:alpha/beta fold hydrolase [Salinicola endophyticus]|uniref:Alpha/beta fold hydrolase n=1 Tax=Salinicola endophyticus TaxID=1949083 RepID=A0ABY8FPF9_9GAMM|nr:alpha/beta fold hydrolase [Salinicola endophyticus]
MTLAARQCADRQLSDSHPADSGLTDPQVADRHDSRHLVILPGWALGVTPLEPLANALGQRLPGWEITLLDYATLDAPEGGRLAGHDVDTWLAALERALPDGAWLCGWSLGGMLATALAARRVARTPGLISLAANACFVARPGWQTAMAVETFDAFRQGYQQAPVRTLGRFAQLVVQGGETQRPRRVRSARELAAAGAQTPPDQALAGLALLEALDLRARLGRLSVPQLHLFAADDALVPCGACDAVAECLPASGRAERIAAAGHAFPLARATETAERIATFITSSRAERADAGGQP